jgi:large subunit ribosomal protein L21
MYAVIESGGKQHRVELGSEIQVDRLDVQPGDSITLDRVLLVADGEESTIGQPVVDGATVSAQVLGQDRGKKIIVFKYKPKARSRVKKGFRAELTTLRITDIAFGGKSAAKDAEKAQRVEAQKAKEAEKAAAEKATADKELSAKLAAAAEPAKDEPAEAEPKATKKKSAAKKADAEPAPEAEPTADAEPAPEAGSADAADDTKKDV